MKNPIKSKFLIIAMFISFLSFGQENERIVLKGKVVADSLDVYNIVVINANTKIVAFTEFDGVFFVNAKANDTLVFKALSFESLSYVLKKEDFSKDVLKIKLEIKLNELNEVVLTPLTLTGNLNIDTKKIKTFTPDYSKMDLSNMKPDTDIRYSKPINSAMSSNMSSLTGIDFIAIFKGIGRLVSGKSNEQLESESEIARRKKIDKLYFEKYVEEIATKPFAEHIKENFSNHFFIEILKLKNDEIPLFLAFAELPSAELAVYLKTENKLKLIEYLIEKATFFKKEKKEE